MDATTEDRDAGKCPVVHGRGRAIRDWWPSRLSLQRLYQHSALSNPMSEAFD